MRASIVGSILLLGCCMAQDPIQVPGPAIESHVERRVIPLQRPDQMNLLFVVDDTAAFEARRPAFLALARQLASGLDSSLQRERLVLHVGAVAATPAASPGSTLGPVVDDAYDLEGNHLTSYEGSFTDAVAALLASASASAPSSVIAPLSAIDRALHATPPFFVDDAYNIVVIATSGDDASDVDPIEIAARLHATSPDALRSAVLVLTDGRTPRLDALVAEFPDRTLRSAWDSTDPQDLARAVLPFRKVVLGLPCFDARVADSATCNVWIDHVTPAGVLQTVPPPCPAAKGTCWHIVTDREACPGPGQVFLLDHVVSSPLGSTVTVECVTQ